jgi:hypothetical protein
MNGDGASGNDLIYIPRNQSEMNFVTFAQEVARSRLTNKQPPSRPTFSKTST